MKVKIIKSLKCFGNDWKKYIGKIYEAEKIEHDNYFIIINNRETFWRKEEVEEIT